MSCHLVGTSNTVFEGVHGFGRVAALIGTGRRRLRDRRRSVARRVFAIGAAARRLKTRPASRRHYRALLAQTRAVGREAETTGRRVSQQIRLVPATTRLAAQTFTKDVAKLSCCVA